MMQRYWFMLFWCLYSYFATAQEQGYPLVHNYTPETYGQAPQVFSVTKDVRGWMYFGVNGNVMKYDGEYWTTIPIPNQSSVYSIAQAPDTTLYVGATGDFGYLIAVNHAMVYQSLAYLLPEKDFKFTSIWQTLIHNGDVYFRCFEAVIRYRPGPKPSIKIFHRNADSFFGGMIVHQNRLYIYHHEIGMQEIGEDSLLSIPQTAFFADKKFYAGYNYTPDSLLVVTRNEGLFIFNPSSKNIPRALYCEDKTFFEGNDIYTMSSINDSLLCLLSIKKGTLVINREGKTVQRLNQEVFTQSNYARQAYANLPNLWITSNTGIDKIDANFDLSYWDKNTGLNDLVEAIVRHQGRIYVGTQHGTYCLVNNKPVLVEGIPTGQTWALNSVQTPNGDYALLAATSKGVFQINGLYAKELIASQEHTSANILYQSRKDPSKLYSTQGKYLLRLKYQNSQWKHDITYTELLEDIRGIAEDKQGNIWLGSFRNGAIYVSIDSLTQQVTGHRYYGINHGFPSLKDIKPFNYQDTVVFGTEYGLYAYSPEQDSFVPYCDLGNDFCGQQREVFTFQEMADGKTWILPLMTQKADIGYLYDSLGKKEWVFEPFRRIPKMMMRGFYAEPNGVVWFGGEKGLYRYDPNKDRRNYRQSFSVHIQQMYVGEDSLVYDGGALNDHMDYLSNIPHETNTIAINYAATFFDHEPQTLYQYRLLGAGIKWSDWTKQTAKEYNYLNEGDYTFEVRAKNIYGKVSNTESLQFTILPPWHRTLWAYALYLLAGVLGLWGLVKYNTYRLTKEKEYLAQVIEHRTAEITQQKNILEGQKEEILLKNTEILLQKEEIEAQADNLREANLYISLQKDEVEKHLKHLAIIVQVGQEITASLNLDSVIDRVYQHVNSLMEAVEFGIGFYNQGKQRIDFKLLVLEGNRLYGQSYNVAEPRLSSWVVRNKKAVWMQNIQEEYSAFIPSLDAYEEQDLLSSVICLPLMVEDRIIGVVSVQSKQKNAYNTYHFDLLQALSAYIAVALDNSNAYHKLHLANLQLEEKVKQRTEQIKQAFDELLNAHQQLDNLTYRSAHDLRGPIARLEGLCNVAKLEMQSDTVAIAYFQKISDEATRMDALLNRMMLTQSIKTKEVKPSPVFVDNLILDILKCYEGVAKAQGITVKFLRDSPIRIFSDYMLIEHLLKNVIDNAFKFYKENNPEAFIEVSAIDLPNRIEVRIIDNGLGIIGESRYRVFEMFFVNHEDRRGYGLGLFDAAIIAEKLKGRIILADRADNLTEFVITLPKKAVFLHWTQMIS